MGIFVISEGGAKMKKRNINKRICCFVLMLLLLTLSSVACKKGEPAATTADSAVTGENQAGSGNEANKAGGSAYADVYQVYIEEARQKVAEITIDEEILDEMGMLGKEEAIIKDKTKLAFDLSDLDHNGTPELIMFKKYYFPNEYSLSKEKIAAALEVRIITSAHGAAEEIFRYAFYDVDDLIGFSPVACLQYCMDKETGDKFILRGGIMSNNHGDNSFYYIALELQDGQVVEEELFRLYEAHAYAYMDDPNAEHIYKHKGEEVSKEAIEQALTDFEKSFERIDIFNYKINRADPLVNLLDTQDYGRNAEPLDEERMAKILSGKDNLTSLAGA
jgi:hypothetical protein